MIFVTRELPRTGLFRIKQLYCESISLPCVLFETVMSFGAKEYPHSRSEEERVRIEPPMLISFFDDFARVDLH